MILKSLFDWNAPLMNTAATLADAVKAYLAAGLCILPAKRAEKRPAVGRWKQYNERLPTDTELSAWMDNSPDAVCIVCGQISGNLEIIDFDAGGAAFESWYDLIDSGLRDRLVIEQTPSGGFHVIYRCEQAICGNLKLAQCREGDKIITLIETRGQGGLFLCAPTIGYEILQGDLCNLPGHRRSTRQPASGGVGTQCVCAHTDQWSVA